MYDATRQIVESSLRKKHPGATKLEIKKKLFVRFYGSDFSEEEKTRILRALEEARQHTEPICEDLCRFVG